MQTQGLTVQRNSVIKKAWSLSMDERMGGVKSDTASF